jgi:uncharacterized protein (TIGR02646 family)
MKYIEKAASPRIYSRWCQAVAGTGKANWGELPAAEKRAVLAALLKEQGRLCAYTMRRIESSSAHVEHIKPQHQCRAERAEADLDYGNLVACYPRDGMRAAYRFGAQHKGEWWEEGRADFVSPLRPECEARLHFGLDGQVAAVDGGRSAETTIQVLALNHRTLVEDRKGVITEFVYGPGGVKPLSRAQASRVREEICNRVDDGSFQEYCVAIRGALEDYQAGLEKMSRRRRAARRRG